MKVEIDIECSNKPTTCKFAQTCLNKFDSSLCCEIIREGSHDLFVSPVSTFKSSNCSYLRQIEFDGRDVHTCSCPVRMEIYRKYTI